MTAAPRAHRDPAAAPRAHRDPAAAPRAHRDPAAAPRAHRDPAAVAAKLRRLDEPHIAPLTELARRIAAEHGGEVPLFDPESGGTAARVLLLLESPGPASATGSGRGSGIISLDNDDPTAANGVRALAEAGLARRETLNWNVVPWYLQSVRAPSPAEVAAAAPWLRAAVDLLPDLRVVVLLGAVAQRAWPAAGVRPDLPTVAAPHPSPQNVNRDRATRWPQLVSALRTAAGTL